MLVEQHRQRRCRGREVDVAVGLSHGHLYHGFLVYKRCGGGSGGGGGGVQVEVLLPSSINLGVLKKCPWFMVYYVDNNAVAFSI